MQAIDTDVTESQVDPAASQLWDRWCTSRTPELRSEIFLHYSPWLRTVSSGLFAKYRYPLAEWADYMHSAAIGLLACIENYDPSLKIPFEAYAYPRVKGATLNGLAVYVSESKKNSDLSEYLVDYSARLHDDYENDDPLISVIDAVVDLALGRFLELGVLVNEDLDNGPHVLYASEQQTSVLHNLLEQLPTRERFIITSHYLNQMEFQLIADVMEISAPRATQLHHQALRRLRKLFEELI